MSEKMNEIGIIFNVTRITFFRNKELANIMENGHYIDNIKHV